jgi:hypothetical protein
MEIVDDNGVFTTLLCIKHTDRDGRVGSSEEVARSPANACAAHDVHGVGDDPPAPVRAALLHDAAEDHGGLGQGDAVSGYQKNKSN